MHGQSPALRDHELILAVHGDAGVAAEVPEAVVSGARAAARGVHTWSYRRGDAAPALQHPAVIVPYAMAAGWFVRSVVHPLAERCARASGVPVVTAPPVGTHPRIAEIVHDLIQRERRPFARIVVVGHGTTREQTSGDSVMALVAGLGGRALARFLDQEPRLSARDVSGDTLVIPFFAVDGHHVRVDIPALLGEPAQMTGARTDDPMGRVRVTAPVGVHPLMSEIVVDCAHRAIESPYRNRG